MPATSVKQQRLFGMVHAVQKGEMKAPSAKIKAMAHSVKPKAVTEFASTSHHGLPTKKKAEDVISFLAKRAADMTNPANRKKVPKSEFAMPDSAPKGQTKEQAHGKYPMPDKAHSRAALGFAAMHHGKGSAEYKAVARKAQQLGFTHKAASVISQLAEQAAQNINARGENYWQEMNRRRLARQHPDKTANADCFGMGGAGSGMAGSGADASMGAGGSLTPQPPITTPQTFTGSPGAASGFFQSGAVGDAQHFMPNVTG